MPTVLLNAAFLFNFVPGKEQGIVMASWTIGVEMVFYALFPIIHRWSRGAQIALAVAALVASAAQQRYLPHEEAYFSVVGFIPLFLMGIWTFEIYRAASRTNLPKAPVGGGLILAGIAVLIACALTRNGANIAFRIPIAFGYCSILLGFGLRPTRLLSARPLRLLGAISYSTYLIHAPIILKAGPLFAAIARRTPAGIALFVDYLVVMAIVVPVAYALYRLVELPCDRLGRSLTTRLADARGTRVATS